jgi:hypothetical protein
LNRYLRLSVRIHEDIFTPERLQISWAILQIRNPLLAVRVESNFDSTFANPIVGPEGEVDPKKYVPIDGSFVYDVPQSFTDAIKRVKKHVEVISQPAEPIRNFLAKYLDGGRTLSDDLVCKLLVVYAHPEDVESHFTPPSEEERNPFNPHPIPTIPVHLILLCAHFIGDAGSIQFISKDLMYLLSFSTEELKRMLEKEVEELVDAVRASGGAATNDYKGEATLLPASLEGRLPPIRGRFKNVLSKMEFMKWQSRNIVSFLISYFLLVIAKFLRSIGWTNSPKKVCPESRCIIVGFGLVHWSSDTSYTIWFPNSKFNSPNSRSTTYSYTYTYSRTHPL